MITNSVKWVQAHRTSMPPSERLVVPTVRHPASVHLVPSHQEQSNASLEVLPPVTGTTAVSSGLHKDGSDELGEAPTDCELLTAPGRKEMMNSSGASSRPLTLDILPSTIISMLVMSDTSSTPLAPAVALT